MKKGIKIIFLSAFFWSITMTVSQAAGFAADWRFLLVGTGIAATVFAQIREKSRNILFFFLLHGSIVAVDLYLLRSGSLLLKDASTWKIGLLEILAIALYSILMRLKRELEQPSVIYIVVVACMYLGASVAQLESASVMVYSGVFVMVLCYLFYENMEQVDLFIMNRGPSTKMDTVQLRKISNGLTFVYLMILAILLAAFGRLPADRLTQLLGTGILRLVRWVMGFFSNATEQEAEIAAEPEAQMGGIPDIVPGETSRLALILEEIFKVLGVIAIAAIAIAAIIGIATAIYRKFYQNTKGEDEQEFISPFVREQVHRQKQPVRKESFSDRTNRWQLRRLYKKYMARQWQKQEEKLNCMTPQEQTMGKQDIAALYEKARYSEAVVTREDIARMKEELKNFGS